MDYILCEPRASANSEYEPTTPLLLHANRVLRSRIHTHDHQALDGRIRRGLVQAFCFAPLVNRLGPRALLRVGHTVISCIAKRWGITWVVWALLACQMALAVGMDMSLGGYDSDICGCCQAEPVTEGCTLMYITASAPNRRSLGALNDVAQTTASVVRAIGPVCVLHPG
jgi:hypothetical protein